MAALTGDAKLAANWVMGDFSAYLNAAGVSVEQAVVDAEGLAELLALLVDGTLSGKLAKEVFTAMTETGRGPGPSSPSAAWARSPTPGLWRRSYCG